jgi:hypothetical protein
MTEQEIVDYFAKAAKPRLMELLRLKVRHIYEMTPGEAKSKLVVDGFEVEFKAVRAVQPYKDIDRFATPDKVIGFVVNPGLLPIVKAILLDLRGKSVLVTRNIQSKGGERGVVAQLEEFGVRVRMSSDPKLEETHLEWEALYAVAN